MARMSVEATYALDVATVRTLETIAQRWAVAKSEALRRLTAVPFSHGGRRRGTLADRMIAATAIRRKATLATTTPGEFRRFASESSTIVEA